MKSMAVPALPCACPTINRAKLDRQIKKTSLFGKRQIELSGRCNSEPEKTKIEEIAKELSEGLEVVSTIRLGRTG